MIYIKVKLCTKCGRGLPATYEYFQKRKRSKDGLNNQCKECINKYQKEYFKINKKARKECNKKYYDSHKTEIQKYCKDNSNKRCSTTKKWKETNIEKVKEYFNSESIKERIRNNSKIWRKLNPDKNILQTQKRRAKAKRLVSNFTNKEWNECKEYFNNRCAYCGASETLTQDHFIPLSKGGNYTARNIIPSCKSCNSSKGSKNFYEWYKSRTDIYSIDRMNKVIAYLNSFEEKIC